MLKQILKQLGHEIDDQELTKEQQEIVQIWGPQNSFDITSDFIVMPSGEIACVQRFLFTHAIIYGLTHEFYLDRWCYGSYSEALYALAQWHRDFDLSPEPIGWHRHPSTGRRIFEGHCEVRM